MSEHHYHLIINDLPEEYTENIRILQG